MDNAALKQSLLALGEAGQGAARFMLNYGGCAVWASLVAHRLAALNIHAVGVVLSNSGWNAKENAQNRHYPGTLIHVLLEVQHNGETFYYDSDHVWDDSRGVWEKARLNLTMTWGLEVAEGSLSLDELEDLAQDDSWTNDMFPRRTIPQLTELVNTWTP